VYDAHEFLRSLTVVLVVAGVTTVVFQRLRQPVVLGYILAGLIVGPHVPLPIVADRAIVETLSELGVILLMFALGLEFSLGKLIRVGPTAGFTAVVQCSVMAWLGFLIGRLFGWTTLESVFTGAIIAISSTTIIVKVFDEQRIGGRLRELVVGILLFEDLIAIVLMAALTAIASGAGLSPAELGATLGRLGVFLAALLALGMLVVPRFMRLVVRIGRPETTLVTAIGIAFGTAYLAQAFGYSVALGAFLAGSLVAESGHAEAIERLVVPVRDVFAAIFFVSVGLLIDPSLALRSWPAVLTLAGAVIAGNIVAVSTGAFLTGTSPPTAIRAGMSLAQIGEFSFIIAALGQALGATRDFLYPVAVAVSALTALTTPWMVRYAGTVAAWGDRKLPHRLQTYATLYATWLERLRARSAERKGTRVARIVRLLVLDTVVLAAVIIGARVSLRQYTVQLAELLGLSFRLSYALIIAAAFAASVPLLIGIGRLAIRLGRMIAATALPKAASGVDFDAAPRRALVITVELGTVLIVGIVVVAITAPFLPSYAGFLFLGLLAAGFGIALWRSAANLEGHVEAGAQAVVQALASYSHANDGGEKRSRSMSDLHTMMPGLGAPVAFEVPEGSASIGRSLAEINLRGETGASVLAISRDGEAIVVPGAEERLRVGDRLAIVGTVEAVDAAQEKLSREASGEG
jgi:CPA2 family monovalent cation:H+ antiporter-2